MNNILDDASIEETIRVQKKLKRERIHDWLYYHSLKYLVKRLIANHRQKMINKHMAKQLGIKDYSTEAISKAIDEELKNEINTNES